jgi:multiple sugar transport system permease protein
VVDYVSSYATRRPKVRRILAAVAQHAVAIAISFVVLVPFIVVVGTAFMTQKQSGTGSLWPHPWVWSNFGTVFKTMPFLNNVLNSVIYAVATSAGVMISSTLTAYGLSRIKWKGRDTVFIMVLAAMMVPPQVTSLPLYILYAKFGLIGTLWPLILPPLLGDAYSIFLLRQFFLTIPLEMSEAARLDGAGEFKIMMRVIVPMTKPGIAAIGLFQFIYAWTDFYNPLIYTGNTGSLKSQTLAVAMNSLATSSHIHAYNLQMAASLMFTLPLIIIFFLAQKVFVEGISITGVKG